MKALYWPGTNKCRPRLTQHDQFLGKPVPPYTGLLPPSTNQNGHIVNQYRTKTNWCCLILTQYQPVPTHTALYWPSIVKYWPSTTKRRQCPQLQLWYCLSFFITLYLYRRVEPTWPSLSLAIISSEVADSAQLSPSTGGLSLLAPGCFGTERHKGLLRLYF